MRERVGLHQRLGRAGPVQHAGRAQVGHGEALGRQVGPTAFGLIPQVLLDHAKRHGQAALGGLGQLGLAPRLGHGHAVHQHGERVGLGLGHHPEAPAQGLGVFARCGRGDAAAIGHAMVARHVERAGHAFPHHHAPAFALGPFVHHHRDVAVGVERQKIGGARGAALIGQADVAEIQAQFAGGPQGANGARGGNAVDGEAHVGQ